MQQVTSEKNKILWAFLDSNTICIHALQDQFESTKPANHKCFILILEMKVTVRIDGFTYLVKMGTL